MHTNDEPKVPSVTLGYETEDVNMHSLGKWARGFFGMTILMFAVAYGIFYVFHRDSIKEAQEPRSPFARVIPSPPNPLLQTNKTAKTDMMDLRREEQVKLTTPDWIDKPKGIVRIPVQTAMDEYIQSGGQGGPIANPAPAAPAPTATPTEAPVNP